MKGAIRAIGVIRGQILPLKENRISSADSNKGYPSAVSAVSAFKGRRTEAAQPRACAILSTRSLRER